METRSIKELKESYVRGPHVRYFFTAMAIAFSLVVVLFGCFVLIVQLIKGSGS